jgi:excisionase family DNA binding protein
MTGDGMRRGEKGAELEPLALSVAEAARVLRVSRTTVYRLAWCGKIRVVKVGGRTIVPMSEIRRLLGE